MRRILLILILILITTAFAGVRDNTTCYLYQLRGDELILIQTSDKPLIAKDIDTAVIILDKGKEPSKEQLDGLKANIKAKISKANEPTQTEKDIALLKQAVEKLNKGEDITNLLKTNDMTPSETAIVK